jgi:hypothetical protein
MEKVKMLFGIGICFINRVIFDEIHCNKNSVAKIMVSTYRWGITATPMSKSKDDVAELLKTISNSPSGKKEFITCGCILNQTTIGQAIRSLDLTLVKKVVMRHSKQGEKAFGAENPDDSIVLPSRSVRNVTSKLSENEQIVYDFVASQKAKAIQSFARYSTGDSFTIDNMIGPLLQAVNSPGLVTLISNFEMPAFLRDKKKSPEYIKLKQQCEVAKLASERCKSTLSSKFRSLKTDLEEKLRLNPSARVLILTRSLRLLPQLITSIQQIGFHVESFTGIFF